MQSLYFKNISVSDVTDYLHIDRSYLFKLFKQYADCSLQEYLINIRIENAKKYLKAGKKVKETATCVGIDDFYYFSRLFKNKTGFSPTEYQKYSV